MDIYERLPLDIQRKMFQYFRHPIAQQLHNYPWVIPQIIYQWTPPPTTRYRIALAKMLANPTGIRHRCGCIYYEQHQVCCNDIPEEELDSWDPVVRATPIQQAIWKSNICYQIKKKKRKGRFGCLKMYEEEARAMIEEENFTDDIDVDLLIDNKKITNRQI